MPALTIGPHTTSHHGAGIMIGSKETLGKCYPIPPQLPWIMDLKVIEVWCQWPQQYHCNLTGQKALGIPIMADIIGKLEAT